MAIVKMQKLSLIGLDKDKDQILQSLMKMGVVEIEDIDPEASEDWSKLVYKDKEDKLADKIETDISKVKSAIEYLAKFDLRKKGLFEPKRLVDKNSYDEILASQDDVWAVVNQIGAYDEELNALKSEENRLQNTIMTLTPWKKLAIPLEVEETKSTNVILGTVPAVVDVKKLEEQLYSNVAESYIESINSDKDQNYLVVIYHKVYEEEAIQILKQFGLTKVSFKDMTGTVEQNINDAQKRIKAIETERDNIKSNISGLTDKKQAIEIIHDSLLIKRDSAIAQNKLARTDSVFVLEGWLPEFESQKVLKCIQEKWDCIIEIREPEKDEEFPVMLKNNSFVQPFEAITQLYSLPNSKGIDPNLFMAPFYFMFFGLMVSDAGYGLVLSLVTGLVLYKFKLEGLAYKLIKLIFFCGISTLLWGALFGGWFGNIVEVVTNGKYTVSPIWFNPLDDPMKLLIFSFIFGGIHLFVGMGLQAYKLIRDGKVKDAIFDVGFWYMVLIGLVLLAMGGTLPVIGKYMSIGGAIGLVLTQGRSEKSIVKKLMSGILSLYNVTGYLSDVLSYSRLLALGLATGVIANVVNTMGALFGMNIVGIILLAIIFVVGHVFNIAINALGAYVHASRLQYVEFFGKFFEGGGKEFKPFKINTKYVDVKNEEVI